MNDRIAPARPVPLDLSAAFARFRNADPERLHFAAHSHHFWPDVARDAHIKAWDDAARLADDKWVNVLDIGLARSSAAIARHLGLADATTLVPAPNTHEFVNRLLSCCPTERPARVLTTDGEFHSFRRQSERLAEDGLIALRAVPAEPFATLAERLAAAARELAPDLVYVSQVLFSSGFALADLSGLVATLAAPDRLIVIDGYHGFLARPTDLAAIADRAFYIAGGYKYAMAGEGACFMHCPPGIAAAAAQHRVVCELRQLFLPAATACPIRPMDGVSPARPLTQPRSTVCARCSNGSRPKTSMPRSHMPMPSRCRRNSWPRWRTTRWVRSRPSAWSCR